jgi:hypothetical protein
MNTPDHANVPLPAGLEFFPVFDGLTVHTGGTQIVEDDGQVYVLRDVRVLGPVIASLLDSQAREFARALTAAADYIAEMTAGGILSDPEGMIA